MNTGQMMLVIGAFSMLSILALSFNRTMLGSLQLGLEMQATLNGLSIAQSMMDEVLPRSFDQAATSGTVIYQMSLMTAPNALGPEGAEIFLMTQADFDSSYWDGPTFYDFKSKSRFNDVDDYNGYRRLVFDSRLGYFSVYDTVKYCSEFQPDRDTTSQTYYKKVTVVVTHPNLPRTETDTSKIILRGLAIYRQFF